MKKFDYIQTLIFGRNYKPETRFTLKELREAFVQNLGMSDESSLENPLSPVQTFAVYLADANNTLSKDKEDRF